MIKLTFTLAAAMLTTAFAASAASSASGVATASNAGTIYEWVDDSGRTHASDTVPDKYVRVAKRVDPNRSRIPAGERSSAEREAAALKARAASEAYGPPLVAATTDAGLPRAGSLSQRPAEADSPKCVAWRRQLAASRECFVYTSKASGKSRTRSCSAEPDPEPACSSDGSR